MNLRYITCSGVREYASVEKIIELSYLSKNVEIAFPGDPLIMGHGKPGNEWLSETFDILSSFDPINLAIHVVDDWCTKFCKDGNIDADLYEWFDIKHKTGQPLIKRWQFDLYGRPENFNPYKVAKIISNYPDREFIFLYYDSLKTKFSRLNEVNAKFSLIYRNQFDWLKPVFTNIPQGYSGKLSADNINFNLGRVNKLVPKDYDTWVEANKLLINPAQEFDFHFAEKFIRNVLEWNSKQNIIK